MEQQLAQLLAQVAVSWDTLLARVQTSPQQMLAHGAVLMAFVLTLAGAYARTMMPLRWLAAASGVASLAYAVLAPAPITLLTAGLLLPLNLWRAVEVTRLTQRVRRAGVQADMAGVWLKPYMKSRRSEGRAVAVCQGRLRRPPVHAGARPGRAGRDRPAAGARPHLRRDRAVLARPDAHADRARRQRLHRAGNRRQHRQGTVLPEPRIRLPPDGAAGRAPGRRRAARGAFVLRRRSRYRRSEDRALNMLVCLGPVPAAAPAPAHRRGSAW